MQLMRAAGRLLLTLDRRLGRSGVRFGGTIALCALLSGCAATLTTAWGEDAAARLFAPQACLNNASAYSSNDGAPLTKRTETVERDGKVGPDDVTTTVVVEPVIPEQQPLAESNGSKISETGGGVIRTAFGFLGGMVKGLFGILLP